MLNKLHNISIEHWWKERKGKQNTAQVKTAVAT